MKKSLILSCVAFIIAIAGLTGIILNVSGQAERVYLTEEVLIGDKAYAEDISFQIHSQWEEKLSWETFVDLGEETKVDTEFTFYPDGMNIEYDTESEVALEYYTGFGYSSSAHLLGEEGPADLPYKKVFEDVASRTEKGEERKEVVKLADYYEYIDMNLHISSERYLPHYIYAPSFESSEYELIQEAIGMHVPEDLTFEAKVTRNEDGNVYSVSGNVLNDEMRIVSGGVVLKSGCYMYVSVIDEEGVVSGLSDTGYGIYKVPFTWEVETTQTAYSNEGDETAVVHYEDFALMYPTEEKILSLQSNVEESELFLLISRDGELFLQRIDCESFALLQELALGIADEAAGCMDFKVTEEGILLFLSDGTLYYAEDKGEKYEITVSYNMWQNEFFSEYQWWSLYAYDYKDGRLAVIWRGADNSYSSNDAYVFVLEGDGMKFLAHYKNSLNQADANIKYANTFHPVEPFKIYFEE